MVKPQLVLVTALLLLTSGAAAQELGTDLETDAETSNLGEDVLSYNFVMRGLPGSSQEEVEADRSFEQEEDGDESYNLSEDEALEIAREELGSSEWNLEDSEQSEGLYEFTFVRGESEAEVSVDGSSGRIVEFEAEVEWEPENEEPSAVLSGFIQFSREGYEVDTDIEVDEESNEASFEVEIEQEDELGAEVINREEIREFEEAAPGTYTGRLEVVRDDEVVHTEEQEFRVPGPVENVSDNEEESEDEEVSEESLENMSREELIEEVRSLREQVQSLQNRIDSGRPESPGNRPDGIDTPEDEEDSEESENETEDEEDETEESESENETDDSESSGPPNGAPGNSDQRPGFVNRMLSGIFR